MTLPESVTDNGAADRNFRALDDRITRLNIFVGTGSPETVVAATVGALFLRTDGGASTTLYVKESGTGNTGWVAK